MARFVVFTLALVASASASFLPFLERQPIVEQDVIGEFRIATSLGSACPRFINHSATVDLEQDPPYSIPHTEIFQNRRACRDEGKLSIFIEAQEAKNVLGQNEELKALIDDFQNTQEKIIFGVERRGRECAGDKRSASFSPRTVVILFNPEAAIRVGGIEYLPGWTYMVIDDPQKPGICIYRKRPTPPSPSPEEEGPSPGPDGPGPVVVPPGQVPDGQPTPTPDGDIFPDGESPSPIPEDDLPSPTPSPEDDGSICFPADATVEMEDGSIKKMSQIELGDRVKVADGSYSDVFMFTHKDASAVHEFVRISTVSGASLTATRGHYIYINGGFAAAGSAKAGDVLQLGNGAQTVVSEVSIVKSTGLFNPQTVQGDIIVNSIRASTFTRTIEPSTAQAMLAPLRMLYGSLGFTPTFLDNGADTIASFLPKGQVAL